MTGSSSPSISWRSSSPPAARSEERAAFVDAIVRAAADPERRAIVVVALRADHYGQFAAYPALGDLLASSHVLVGPLQPSELRRAVELPAARAGLTLEPGLSDALIDDVEGEPGRCRSCPPPCSNSGKTVPTDTLTVASYRRSGGVHAAVARLAEGTYARVPEAHQPLVRAIMLRLVASNEGESPVRRRAALQEFELDGNPDVAGVLQRSPTAASSRCRMPASRSRTRRCCASGPACATGSRRTIRGRRLHRQPAQASSEWDRASRDDGELYRGARLAATPTGPGEHERRT